MKPEDRSITLLRACWDFLNQHRESPYELEVLGQSIYYDGSECDGYCLLDDIEAYLIEHCCMRIKEAVEDDR